MKLWHEQNFSLFGDVNAQLKIFTSGFQEVSLFLIVIREKV